MNPTLPGIHHVTAITADAQKNIDFYCGVLGLRMVKLTVNFDDPTSYHLYYGDEQGRPGTAMTFFSWPAARRGRIGPPQVTSTSFAVPVDSLSFWAERLKEMNVETLPVEERFDESVLAFADPDGIGLEIVATATPGGFAPKGGPIPAAHAIRGFHGVTLSEQGPEPTAALLKEGLGFNEEGKKENRTRYRAAGDGFASVVDILDTPNVARGFNGAGTVHHVAFRTPDDARQKTWQTDIGKRGLNVSPVMDRCYFHSIYFREPGGVLFEIATNGPGFTADESPDSLGQSLKLPPWMESDRAELEKVLTPLRLPEWK